MRNYKRIPFTQEGFEKLKKEYEDLLAKRPAAVATLKQAREMGDLSENGLYKAARSNLSSIDFNLRRLNLLVKLAVVSESLEDNTVQIGSKITVSDGKIQKNLILVGEYEADPKLGKVSVKSPIGHALQGKKVGDRATIPIPSGSVMYEIIEIS